MESNDRKGASLQSKILHQKYLKKNSAARSLELGQKSHFIKKYIKYI